MDSKLAKISVNDIGRDFANKVSIPSRADRVFFNFDFVSPSDIQPPEFVRTLRGWSREDRATYLGILPARSVKAA